MCKFVVLMLSLLIVAAAPAQNRTEPTNAAEAAAKKPKTAAALDEKYQAWVGTLNPQRQAWERVLQSELGGFYLPIHKRQKVAGQSNAWDFVKDDPELPRVLLIGDSRRGPTRKPSAGTPGKANVHRAPANCGPTATDRRRRHLAETGNGTSSISTSESMIATPASRTTQTASNNSLRE